MKATAVNNSKFYTLSIDKINRIYHIKIDSIEYIMKTTSENVYGDPIQTYYVTLYTGTKIEFFNSQDYDNLKSILGIS